MKSSFFASNRKSLVDPTGSLVVLTAYQALQESNDMAARFTQEANFWYVSGITEPDWWIIVDGQTDKSWLVAPDIDEVHRLFDGGMTFELAQQTSGVSGVIPRKEAESLLRRLSLKHSVVRSVGQDPYASHYNFYENPAQKQLWRMLERTFNSVQDCRKDLAKLRAIKQPEEIKSLRKAIQYTSEAFEAMKVKLPDLIFEYEVEAEFDYSFKRYGLKHAYSPIVAGGKNACTLHYDKNSDRLKSGSLLLLDIGARYEEYSADISRTYAIGQPTKRQQVLHAAVAQAHQEIISLLKPGVSVVEYHESVDRIMKQRLVEVGLLASNSDEEGYRQYFPHAISHGLGIDTHDSLGAPGVFKEGMVLTVEPGIYIAKEGIGIRIEDDILITAKGHENLSRRLSTDL